MGHAEAASTMCSIAKVIISMKSGVIPANINYTTPRSDIDALHNGLVEVSMPVFISSQSFSWQYPQGIVIIT